MSPRPLMLHITELSRGRGLLLEYTDPETTDNSETHYKRELRFDSAKEKLTIHYGRFEDGYYDTEGLSSFARKGLGTFQASAIPLISGVAVAYRVEYLLTRELFMYTWHRSVSRGPFVTINHVTLARADSSSPSGPGHP